MTEYRRRLLLGCAVSLALHASLIVGLSAFSSRAPHEAAGEIAFTLETESLVIGAAGGEAGPVAVQGERRPERRPEAPSQRETPVAAPTLGEESAPEAVAAAPVAVAPAAGANGESAIGESAKGGSVAATAAAGAALGEAGTAPIAEPGDGGVGGLGDTAPVLAARLGAAVGAAIEARKTYPEAARRRGGQGVVRLRLLVSAEGRLISAKLAASSGSTLLDRAALDLATSVFPVDNIARVQIVLELAVRYSLGDKKLAPE